MFVEGSFNKDERLAKNNKAVWYASTSNHRRLNLGKQSGIIKQGDKVKVI